MAIYSGNRDYSHISRYRKYRQIIDDNVVYTETFNQQGVSLSNNDITHIVKLNEKNRLDMIALTYYKDASLWWILALANNIINPFIVVPGTVLRVPPLINLYNRGEALYRNG